MNRVLWRRFLLLSTLAVFASSLLVVLGLVLESDWIIDAWHRTGELFVIMGVTSETLFDGGIFLASKRLEAIQEKELVEMRRETAHAEERAAEANKIAEQERLERLKLEESLAPRQLSQEQIAMWNAALKPHAGQAIDLFFIGNDPEVGRFTNQIRAGLGGAGWQVTVFQALNTLPFNGIMLETTADAAALTSGNALDSVMFACGLRRLGPMTSLPHTGPAFLGHPEGKQPNASIRLTIMKK